jgi:hypothetical protein
MIGDLIFYIRYNVYVLLKKIVSPKKREYIAFFMGKYPENFRHGFKAVLDLDSMLRYSISQSTIVARFTTTKKITEIQQTFNRVYSGYADTYFLFEVSKTPYVNFLCPQHYKHLYDASIPQKPIDESLDRVQHFIDVITKMKREFMNMFNEIQSTMVEEPKTDNEHDDEITMEEIDPILDKIKEDGIDSLTEKEKIILKKYTKND